MTYDSQIKHCSPESLAQSGDNVAGSPYFACTLEQGIYKRCTTVCVHCKCAEVLQRRRTVGNLSTIGSLLTNELLGDTDVYGTYQIQHLSCSARQCVIESLRHITESL